jgi:large subunit ribosomal protein L6
MRALVANMVTGVTKGFEKKLRLVGVGYRAQAQGDKLNLRSASRTRSCTRCQGHQGATPTQTEIVDRGSTSSSCQVAAEVRAHRPAGAPTRARACATPRGIVL